MAYYIATLADGTMGVLETDVADPTSLIGTEVTVDHSDSKGSDLQSTGTLTSLRAAGDPLEISREKELKHYNVKLSDGTTGVMASQLKPTEAAIGWTVDIIMYDDQGVLTAYKLGDKDMTVIRMQDKEPINDAEAKLVEELVSLREQKASITSRIKDIENTLRDTGVPVFRSHAHTIDMRVQEHQHVDYKSIVEHLKPSEYLIKRYTRYSPVIHADITSHDKESA